MKTKSTTAYKKWEIVLLPFPFNSTTTEKKRPGLIVSPEEFNKGKSVIILQISSNIDLTDKMVYEIKNWKDARLFGPSVIRMKFATIDKNIISKKIGKLSQEDIDIFKNYL